MTEEEIPDINLKEMMLDERTKNINMNMEKIKHKIVIIRTGIRFSHISNLVPF